LLRRKEMEYIGMGFLGLVMFIVLYGIYKILISIKFTLENERYTYVTEEDEYGNTYEKVIDHNDKSDREWKWKV